MKERPIDIFLSRNEETRYSLSRLSGIRESTLAHQAKNPLSKLPVSTLRALGMLTGLNSWSVLEVLESIEAELDPLLGFRDFLISHECTFPLLELELKELIDYADLKGIEIQNFAFNRFNEETHENMKKDVRKALENAISQLSELINTLE